MTTKARGKSVDFATVTFYDNELPSQVRLDDLSLRVDGVRADSLMISAFYGYQNKLNGLSAARQYAEQNDKEMLVVDIAVTMENYLKLGVTDFASLPDAEFINLYRLSRGLIDELAAHWIEWIKEDAERTGRPFNQNEVNWNYPDRFVSKFPKYVENVFNIWPSLKTIVYPAYPNFLPESSVPIYMGAIHLERCKGSVTAQARMNPEVEILIP